MLTYTLCLQVLNNNKESKDKLRQNSQKYNWQEFVLKQNSPETDQLEIRK